MVGATSQNQAIKILFILMANVTWFWLMLLLFFPAAAAAAASSFYFSFHFYVFTQNDYGLYGEYEYVLCVCIKCT